MPSYNWHRSGVYALSGGLSSDFRDLGAAADEGNEKAKLALDAFRHKVVKTIGGYLGVMNGGTRSPSRAASVKMTARCARAS